MGRDVLHVFAFRAVNVARNVEVVVVGGDFGCTHHTRIFRHFKLSIEHIDDFMNVLMAQTVLVAILHKALAGVDHEDTLAARGILLVEHKNTSRDACAIK